MTYELADTLTTRDAAKLLMVDERHVRRLAAEGWFPRSEGGHYVMATLVQGYVRSLQERRKPNSRIMAENRVSEARAQEIEARTASLARRLGSIDELEAVLFNVIADFENAAIGLGAATTDDLKMRLKVDNAVAATIARTRSRAAKKIAALRE